MKSFWQEQAEAWQDEFGKMVEARDAVLAKATADAIYHVGVIRELRAEIAALMHGADNGK